MFEIVMTLNPKQQVFVAAYIGEAKHNATEAARLAGYKHPGQQGHAQLKKVEIQNAIDEHLEKVQREGIANQQYRIDALVRRHKLLEQVIAERAIDDSIADVPGGRTGIVVKQLKNVKHIYEPDPAAKDGRVHQVSVEVWESAVDTALLRELREHEKQVAQELGEWTEKSELSGPNGAPLRFAGVLVPLPEREDGNDE